MYACNVYVINNLDSSLLNVHVHMYPTICRILWKNSWLSGHKLHALEKCCLSRYCFEHFIVTIYQPAMCILTYLQAEGFVRVYPPFINFFDMSKEALYKCDKTYPRFHAFLKVCALVLRSGFLSEISSRGGKTGL